MDDLKLIKKQYGENMMHLCRETFPSLLETEGLLYKLLTETYYPTKSLYDEIVDNNFQEYFKGVIYSKTDFKKYAETDKTPQELLDQAGYVLYECHSEEDIQKFKKYYAKNETLCTFRGGRLNRCHVFFAVKKNVDKIKRENFQNPNRQDEYGTSVISIQFTRDNSNTLSIKNRYNHSVENSDATFSNNLENIIPGLTNAFNKCYNLNINESYEDVRLPNFVRATDKKYYQYNYEENNIYYCPDNIIIDNFEAKQYDKSRYIVTSGYIIDLQEKQITQYDKTIKDSFIDSIEKIDNIRIEKNDDEKIKNIIINDNIVISLNYKNEMISYKNLELEEIGDNFLYNTHSIINLEIPNIKKIGNNFMYKNNTLKSINFPNVEIIGDYFLNSNSTIKDVKFPKVKEIGNSFFKRNYVLDSIYLPIVEKIGDDFLDSNDTLKAINLPNVKEIGNKFLYSAVTISDINLPMVEKIGHKFLTCANAINNIDFPNVKEIGDYFLAHDSSIDYINLPQLEQVGNKFLADAYNIGHINLCSLKSFGYSFLEYTESIDEIALPYDYKSYYCLREKAIKQATNKEETTIINR